MAQVAEDPFGDEVLAQVVDLDRWPDSLKDLQVADTLGATPITLGDGSPNPHQLSKQSDETIRASGEHAADIKERVATPEPLPAIKDVATTNCLDVNRLHIEPSTLSTKTKPVREVGDFQYDLARNENASLDLREDIPPEELPEAAPALEIVPSSTTEVVVVPEVFKTGTKPEDCENELILHQLKQVIRPGSPYIQVTNATGTADTVNRLVHPERGFANENKRIFSWERTDGLSTIPEVSEGDSRNSRETSKLSMVDKSSSTGSLSTSLEAPKSEPGYAMLERRGARNRGTCTDDDMSYIDETTQTKTAQQTTGWHNALMLFWSVLLFVGGIISHYTFEHYSDNIQDFDFDFWL